MSNGIRLCQLAFRVPTNHINNLRFSPNHILLLLALAALVLAAYSGCSSPQNVYSQFRGLSVDQVARRGYDHLVGGAADSAIIYFASLTASPQLGATDRQLNTAAGYLCRAADRIAETTHDYSQAFEYLLTARDMAENVGNDSLVNEADFRIAGISYIYQDYDKSRQMIRECFDRAVAGSQQAMALKTLLNMLARSFVEEKGYTALSPQLARLDSLHIKPTSQARFVQLFRQAAKECEDDDLEASLATLGRCMSHIDATWDDGQSRYVVETLRAVIYRSLGHYGKAIECIRNFGSDADDPEKRFRIYNGLWHCYDLMGNGDSAHYYMERRYEVMDSAFGVSRYGSLRNMELRGQMESAARDYHILQVRSDLHLAMFWLAVAFLLVVAAMSWRLYNQHRRLLARNAELYRQYQARRDSEERLMKAAQAAQGGDKPGEKSKYAASALSQQEMMDISAHCRQVLEQGEEVYDAEFKIERLAEMVGVPKYRVSQAINGALGQNFGTFVADLRVRRACAMLTDPDTARRQTIEAIAEGVGFRSRTYFVTVFKRVTGLTPTEYQRAAKAQSEGKRG